MVEGKKSPAQVDGTGASATTAIEPVFDVFISYNRDDGEAVKEIARLLSNAEINVWLDEWNLIPGEPWQAEIERILRRCRSVAVVTGPGGLSSWQREEMRAAINRRVSDTGGLVRVIPVLLPGGSRRTLDEFSFLTATTWVEFSRSLGDEEALYRLICGIRGHQPGQWKQATKEAPTRYYIVIDGTIDKVDEAKVRALTEKLRQYSGDATLTVMEIKSGSVVLVVDGTEIGFERLDYLFQTDQLGELLGRELGLTVQNVTLAEDTPTAAGAGGAW
jgi:hypothetical protein